MFDREDKLTLKQRGTGSHPSTHLPHGQTLCSCLRFYSQNIQWCVFFLSEDKSNSLSEIVKNEHTKEKRQKLTSISSRLESSSTSKTGSVACSWANCTIASTDLWPLYSFLIMLPPLNSFNVGYLLMRYLVAIFAAQTKPTVSKTFFRHTQKNMGTRWC